MVRSRLQPERANLAPPVEVRPRKRALRRIIESRWLREGDEKTLHELADEYGVSAERIRQIESKAMMKMKSALGEYSLTR